MDVNELILLAEEFGLPCIERDGYVSVVGLEQILEFQFHFINVQDENLDTIVTQYLEEILT